VVSSAISSSVTEAYLYRGEDGKEFREVACEAVSVPRVSAVLPILTAGTEDNFACVRAHLCAFCVYACVFVAKYTPAPRHRPHSGPGTVIGVCVPGG
jgi:hypothetical protein